MSEPTDIHDVVEAKADIALAYEYVKAMHAQGQPEYEIRKELETRQIEPAAINIMIDTLEKNSRAKSRREGSGEIWKGLLLLLVGIFVTWATAAASGGAFVIIATGAMITGAIMIIWGIARYIYTAERRE